MGSPIAEQVFLSADSHVLEPGDLWTAAAPAAYRDRVLRVVTEGGVSHREGEGLGYMPLSMSFAAGQRGEFANTETAWESRPAAGYDPAARLEAMAADGVAGEVLYPTLAMGLYLIPDADLKRVSMLAYNDWLADFVSRGGGRVVGAGMLAVDDPARAAADLVAVHDAGLRAAMVPAVAPVPYNDKCYEPLWEAAAGLSIPLSLHVSTGSTLLRAVGPGAGGMNFLNLAFDVQQSCQAMLWGGVFDRHPGLHVSFVEIGIGWIAPLVERMDDVWEQHRGWLKPGLSRPPSEQFRAHCSATFERDRAGIVTRDWPGVGSLMWATDYPHAESSWPHSRQVAEESLAGLGDDERRRIAGGNAAELYRWNPQDQALAGKWTSG